MIAVLVAVQLLAAPVVPADTAAMGAISAISAIGPDTVRTTANTRSDRTHPTHPTHPTHRIHPPHRLIAQEGDAWLGADKFKHAAMSYAITAYTFAATDSEPAAVASAAIAGILKEVYDRKRGSLFSVRDLLWDAVGVALGYATVKQTR